MADFNSDIKKFCGIETVINDDFLDMEDKKNLMLHLKKLYSTKFEWAAPYLVNCFILTHYKQFIDKMHEDDNIEIYKKEKEQSSTEDFDLNKFLNEN